MALLRPSPEESDPTLADDGENSRVAHPFQLLAIGLTAT